MHQTQPRAAIDAYAEALRAYATPLGLACLHTITTLTGSALLAIAFAEKQLSAEEAWALAHLDEDWQIEHWGTDEEAFQRREQPLAGHAGGHGDARRVALRASTQNGDPTAQSCRSVIANPIDGKIQAVSFNPAMPAMISEMQPRRTAVAGSAKSTMPRMTVPTVPTPVQTA